MRQLHDNLKLLAIVAVTAAIISFAYADGEDVGGTETRILHADDKTHAAEIKRLIGEDLPEGFTLKLELAYRNDGGGNVRPTPAAATPYNPDGVIHGKVIQFQLSVSTQYWGKPGRITPYVEGKRHGIEKVYQGNNLHAVNPYENDELHGVRETYHSNGALNSKTTYEHGKAVGESIVYSPLGNVIERTPYHQGERHGERIQYWEIEGESIPRRITPYVKGVISGLLQDFHQTGKLRRSMQIRNGEAHGIEILYDNEGNETRKRYWLNGDIVPKGKFDAEYKEDDDEENPQ